MASILERHTFARLVQQEEEKRRSHSSCGLNIDKNPA
jgi:hypothetical protein